MPLIGRLLTIVMALGAMTYVYIDHLNQVTALRLEIPELNKELCHLTEENRCLEFEAAHFASPDHLLELIEQPTFSHLKYAQGQR